MAYAAEGFTRGFLGTIQGLTALERAQLEAEEARERRARERETRAAAAETLGRVGQAQEVALSGLTPASAQQKLLAEQTGGMAGEGISAEDIARRNVEAAQYATRQGVPARDLTGTYSEAQAYQDYSRRLAGIDPEKSMTARVQGLQLEEITRKAEVQKKVGAIQTDLTNTLARISGTAEAGGMQGLAEEAKKSGLNVKFVPGKDGVGGRINVLGPKGDVLETISNVNDAVTKLESLVMQDFQTRMVPLLGVDGFMSYMQQQQANIVKNKELALKGEEVAIARQGQEDRSRLTRAQIDNLRAETQGKDLEANERREYGTLRSKILELLENPTPENQLELQQAARRAAILNPKEVLVTKTERNPETGVLESITTNVFTGEVQKSLAEGGVPNAADWKAAQAGKKPDGTPLKPEEIARWNAAHSPDYQIKTPTAPAKGARSAIPTTSATTAATGGRGAPPSAALNIPPAPPRTIQQQTRGGIVDTGRPNPAYAAWERKYGQYQAQQR